LFNGHAHAQTLRWSAGQLLGGASRKQLFKTGLYRNRRNFDQQSILDKETSTNSERILDVKI